jgi:glutamyl-tRNA synthetase
VFDVQKLEWMNGEYIRALSKAELLDRLAPVLIAAGLIDADRVAAKRPWMENVAASLRERLRLLPDAVDLGRFYFTDQFEFDAKGVQKHFARPGVDGDLALLADELRRLPADGFSAERAEAVLRTLAETLGRKPAELIHPLRLALTGLTLGPGLFEIVGLLGRDTCVARIDRAVEFIRGGGAEETSSASQE